MKNANRNNPEPLLPIVLTSNKTKKYEKTAIPIGRT
jgi:hypothetical protein